MTAQGGLIVLGLDAGGARAALDLAGIRVDPPTWQAVRDIARGALQHWNRS